VAQRSRIEVVLPALRAQLERGATLQAAAEAVGVSPGTVYGWRRLGRLRPDGPFASAAALAAGGRAKRRRLATVPAAPHPDRRELLVLLGEQARGGSVRAIELLLRELPKRPDDEPLTPEQEETGRWLRSIVEKDRPE
jgi:transposase-like protein